MHNPVPLDVAAIEREIGGLVVGSSLQYLAEVDSTNEQAKRLMAADWQNGTAILTDFQRAGKGRQERPWAAPRGSSLLLSVVLDRPRLALPSDSVMAASLAVAEAIERDTGLSVTLKWPNDVLCRGGKVCGILSEYVELRSRPAVILGIGVNCNFDPSTQPELPPTATSLERELGKPVHRERLAAALFNRLDLWYGDLTKDPDTVFAVWSSRLDTVGHPVIVQDASGTWNGIATGVQRDGGLGVRTESGEVRTLYAGDVSIRKPSAFTIP